MNKKGFTLVELLVVIAIIALLSILVIPNIININKNINRRLLGEKQDEVVNAAQLYGTDYEEIFNGKQEVRVYVWELIDQGVLTVDNQTDGKSCKNSSSAQPVSPDDESTWQNSAGTDKGCMIDPVSKHSMNSDYVILRRESIGVIGDYYCTPGVTCDDGGEGSGNPNNPDSGEKTLVKAVCDAIKVDGGSIVAKDFNGNQCECTYSGEEPNGISTGSDACIITGTNPNNYLKYGSMWRVLGVYKVDGELSAKIITNQTVSN